MFALGETRLPRITFATPEGDFADVAAAETRLFRAADRVQAVVDNTFARETALQEAYDIRNRQIEAATGVKLPNPVLQAAATRPGIKLGLNPYTDLEEHETRWRGELDKLIEKFPDRARTLTANAPQVAGGIAREAEAEFEAAASDPLLTGFARVATSIGGGVWGSFRDPVQVGASIVGFGTGAGRTVLARIGQAVAREAAINAGLEAGIQFRAQKWRREAGLENGFGLAARNVGIAAMFGVAFGGGVQAGREIATAFKQGPKVRAALERIHSGNPEAGDIEAAATALQRPLSDDEKAVVAAAEADIENNAPPAVPDGVTPDEGQIAVDAATRAAEEPLFEPPPDILPLKPPRSPEVDELIDDGQAGRSLSIGGRPVRFGSFEAATLGTDARTFQYKSGADAAGVTDRLTSVRQWDATASGKAFIFERNDGSRVVADGHQRLGLARRLLADDPDGDFALDGYLFREADGWTPADVRALAAKKNMQEGSGTALDAARILRDRPDVLDGSLPTTGPMMRAATSLARLSDEAWGMVVNGLVPEGQGAAVGAMVPDRDLHSAIIADLHQFAPETEREARLLVAQSMRAQTKTESTIDLFGRSEATRTLMGERVKVLDSALQLLRQDKRLFGALAANADVIEEAGNILNRSGNRGRKLDADVLGEIIERLALRVSRVSDFLNRSAEALANGTSRSKAARAFLDDVKQVLDDEGLSGLSARPKLSPETPAAEPGTPESLSVAEAAAPDTIETPDADDLFDMLPAGRDETDSFIFADRDALLDDADRPDDLAELVASCRD